MSDYWAELPEFDSQGYIDFTPCRCAECSPPRKTEDIEEQEWGPEESYRQLDEARGNEEGGEG